MPLWAQCERPSASDSGPETTQVEITLRQGQVLSYVMVDSRQDSRTGAETLARESTTVAQKHSGRSIASFTIERKLVGDHEPETLSLLAWPSPANMNAFLADPDWRQLAIPDEAVEDDMRVYSTPVEQDVTLRLDSTKVYTLAIAWTSEERPDDYAAYMKGIEPDLAAVGARFVYSMLTPRFESSTSSGPAPARVTIVEWPSLATYAELRKRPSYQQHFEKFTSGIRDFEFYRIAPVVRPEMEARN